MFITSFMRLYSYTQARLNRVVDETTRGMWSGAKQMKGEWYWGREKTKGENN